MSHIDPNGRLPDPRLLVLTLDDPAAWRTCCELALDAGIRDFANGKPALTERELQSEFNLNVRGRRFHFRLLRAIYGAAYNGRRLTKVALHAS